MQREAKLREALQRAGRALRWAITYGRSYDHLPHCERKEQRYPSGYVCTCGYDHQEEGLETVVLVIGNALSGSGTDHAKGESATEKGYVQHQKWLADKRAEGG